MEISRRSLRELRSRVSISLACADEDIKAAPETAVLRTSPGRGTITLFASAQDVTEREVAVDARRATVARFAFSSTLGRILGHLSSKIDWGSLSCGPGQQPELSVVARR